MNAKRVVCKAFVCGALALFVLAQIPDPAQAPQVKGHKELSEPAQLIQVRQKMNRKKFIKKLEWKLYEAYRMLVTRTGTGPNPITEGPATILVLKEAGYSVEFHGQKLGDGSLQPIAGDVKSVTLDQLKGTTSRIYRTNIGGGEYADLAIIIVPIWAKLRMLAAKGDTLGFTLIDPRERAFASYSVRPDR
jgi:hypothetical protein